MKKTIIIILIFAYISCSTKTKKIGIQPYGNIDITVIDAMTEILKTSYQTEVYILD